MEHTEIMEINIENEESEIDDFSKNGYKCAKCDKILKTKDGLTTHIRKVHSEIRQKCPQ